MFLSRYWILALRRGSLSDKLRHPEWHTRLVVCNELTRQVHTFRHPRLCALGRGRGARGARLARPDRPGLVRIWSGQEAEIDAREGGLYRVGKRNGGGREAHIDIFEVNRRLRLIYFNGRTARPATAPWSTISCSTCARAKGTTSLRLLGSGIPEAAAWDQTYVRISMGWERFMARIKVTLESPPPPKKPQDRNRKDPPLAGTGLLTRARSPAIGS